MRLVRLRANGNGDRFLGRLRLDSDAFGNSRLLLRRRCLGDSDSDGLGRGTLSDRDGNGSSGGGLRNCNSRALAGFGAGTTVVSASAKRRKAESGRSQRNCGKQGPRDDCRMHCVKADESERGEMAILQKAVMRGACDEVKSEKVWLE